MNPLLTVKKCHWIEQNSLRNDLSDGGHVVVGVVGHDHPTEQDSHDTREMDTLGQCIGGVDEAQHQGELQARVGVQVNLLQQQCTCHSNKGANSCIKTGFTN